MKAEFTAKELNKIKSYRDLVAYGLVSPLKVEILKREFSEISLFLYWITKKVAGRKGDLTQIIKEEITRQIKGPLMRYETKLLRKWFDSKFLKKEDQLDDHLEEHFHAPHNWEVIILQLYHQLKGYEDHDFSILGETEKIATEKLIGNVKQAYENKKVLVIGSWWAGELFFELGATSYTVTIHDKRISLSQNRSEKEKNILDKNFLKNTDVKHLVNPTANEPEALQLFRQNLMNEKVDFLISYQVFNHLYFNQYEANDVIASLNRMFLKKNGIEFHDRSY